MNDDATILDNMVKAYHLLAPFSPAAARTGTGRALAAQSVETLAPLLTEAIVRLAAQEDS